MGNVYDKGQLVTVRGQFGLNVTRLMARALAGTLSVQVQDTGGYIGTDTVTLHPGADNEETRIVSAPPVGNVLTLGTALTYEHQPSELVMEMTDPTTITLRLQTPDGVEAAYTFAAAQVTRDGLGKYSKTITVDQVGTYYYKWESTGTVIAAKEDHFDVKRTEF